MIAPQSRLNAALIRRERLHTAGRIALAAAILAATILAGAFVTKALANAAAVQMQVQG